VLVTPDRIFNVPGVAKIYTSYRKKPNHSVLKLISNAISTSGLKDSWSNLGRSWMVLQWINPIRKKFQPFIHPAQTFHLRRKT